MFQNNSHAQACGAGAAAVDGEKSGKSKLLEAIAVGTQNFDPVKSIHQYVCAFHVYAHDFTRHVEAHHFCAHISEGFHQCLIYDSEKPNARLIGVEYIINEELFKELPGEEKKYWHSHQFEVMSGLLVMPTAKLVPDVAARAAELEEMKCLVNTYGKTFHFWQVDRGDKLPLGPPQLMMSYTEDSQVPRDLVEDRDRRLGVDTAARRRDRQALAKYVAPKQPGCDAWESDPDWKTIQLEPVQVPLKMN